MSMSEPPHPDITTDTGTQAAHTLMPKTSACGRMWEWECDETIAIPFEKKHEIVDGGTGAVAAIATHACMLREKRAKGRRETETAARANRERKLGSTPTLITDESDLWRRFLKAHSVEASLEGVRCEVSASLTMNARVAS